MRPTKYYVALRMILYFCTFSLLESNKKKIVVILLYFFNSSPNNFLAVPFYKINTLVGDSWKLKISDLLLLPLLYLPVQDNLEIGTQIKVAAVILGAARSLCARCLGARQQEARG